MGVVRLQTRNDDGLDQSDKSKKMEFLRILKLETRFPTGFHTGCKREGEIDDSKAWDPSRLKEWELYWKKQMEVKGILSRA